MTDQNATQTAEATSTDGSGSGLSTADISSAMNQQQNDAPSNESGTTAVETRAADNGTSTAQPQGATSTPLFQSDETGTFRSRWQDIQTTFVDDPRNAVEQADNLVADIMKRLADLFANERSQLERQWEQGEDVSTEDLRVALQSYRSFFDRLLSI
jgi:hypothetical protein